MSRSAERSPALTGRGARLSRAPLPPLGAAARSPSPPARVRSASAEAARSFFCFVLFLRGIFCALEGARGARATGAVLRRGASPAGVGLPARPGGPLPLSVIPLCLQGLRGPAVLRACAGRLLLSAPKQPPGARLPPRGERNLPSRMRDGGRACVCVCVFLTRLRGRCALGRRGALPSPLWGRPPGRERGRCAAGRGRPAGGAVGSGGGGGRFVWAGAALPAEPRRLRCGAERRGAAGARAPAAGGVVRRGGRRVRAFRWGRRGTGGGGVPRWWRYPRSHACFSTSGCLSGCHYVLEKEDEVLGVVCLNYHRMYKSVIAEIIQ